MFWAHKPVVCSRCPYFHAMFITSQMREAQLATALVPINANGAVLRELLWYMYTGELSVAAVADTNVLLGLLSASNEYMLDGLQLAIEMHFSCSGGAPTDCATGYDEQLQLCSAPASPPP